ncbi:hypothetical protein NDK47_14400 [Brevibacillus ruminantium]|uniref:BAAT/Acyl-CoA thioester hydrolase C-terminal domain-containing protein n=1 Tax=Brevibacillus ruminantium TaxID=2950604 RepID=A0ABY4WNU5_9BACL|nr:acyl-CoA thioester hydrolase/BAAT C-terminal domain-containing protein [Brevibacillus ruminantium]USG68431.1 hypothetical protein NDK47_14400 [Brevibacillus ruminantium]
MEGRLARHDFPYECLHYTYEKCGHGIRYPYIPTTHIRMNGGTPATNAYAYASAHSWDRILDFLQKISPDPSASKKSHPSHN